MGLIRLASGEVFPPPNCLSSAQVAQRLGITDKELRARRSRPIGQDRGPIWRLAADGYHVFYLPADVTFYIKAKAAAFRAKADLLETAEAGTRGDTP